ncbi:MAG TPA: methyltransferase domain-containing protein [Dehalococcoidales bacterium]
MNEWQEFFDSHASVYDQEIFTKNTANEIEFLVKEFNLPAGVSILDIGCGTGRHSIGLGIRGFRVTGIDISREMLNIAEVAKRKNNVEVDFICIDAQHYTATKMYDGAICLCEGALCLLGSKDDPFEHDITIMRNINRALKAGAKFILTVNNGTRYLRLYNDKDITDGKYDLFSMVESNEMDVNTPRGKKKIKVRERGYTPPELRQCLEIAGFQVESIFGGTAGSWNRQIPKLDEWELMAISRKRPVTG